MLHFSILLVIFNGCKPRDFHESKPAGLPSEDVLAHEVQKKFKRAFPIISKADLSGLFGKKFNCISFDTRSFAFAPDQENTISRGTVQIEFEQSVDGAVGVTHSYTSGIGKTSHTGVFSSQKARDGKIVGLSISAKSSEGRPTIDFARKQSDGSFIFESVSAAEVFAGKLAFSVVQGKETALRYLVCSP